MNTQTASWLFPTHAHWAMRIAVVTRMIRQSDMQRKVLKGHVVRDTLSLL